MFREAYAGLAEELRPQTWANSLCGAGVCEWALGAWLLCTYISAINEIRAIMPIPRELQKREEISEKEKERDER